MRILSFAAVLMLGTSAMWTAPVRAEPGVETRSISVSGEATRLVAPNQVSLRLAVEGRGENAAQAMEQAGKRVADLLKRLREHTDPEQIRALDTQLVEVVKGTTRRWVKDRGEPLEMLATRSVHVDRIIIGRLPAMISDISGADLARVENVTAKVSNAREIETALQLEAADDAREQARALAARLGVELGLPLQVDVQSQYRPQPRAYVAMEAKAMMASDAAGAGYAEAGEQELSARVQIRFELLPPRPQ